MRKELVILPNNLGDVIMATPVLRAVKKRRLSEISFLVEQGFEGGLNHNPFCDRIIPFPRKKIRDLWNEGKFSEARLCLADFVDYLNGIGFDNVVNLSQLKHIALLGPMIDNVCYHGQVFLREGNYAIPDTWSQYLYAIPFARAFNRLHASDVYQRIARIEKPFSRQYDIALSDEERNEAREMLRQKAIAVGDKKLAVLQPGAALPSKRWLPSNFIELGKMLVGEGWAVVVSGAPAEVALAQDIATGIGEGCVCLAGETTFRQAVACLSWAGACVTGDTALMHASSALDVPVYALFGATNPVETGPYSEGNWVFAGRCTSRPCFCDSCKSMLCMKSILPQTVFSCMVSNNPGTTPRCDIYRTSFDEHGYTLLPVAQSTLPYFQVVTATFVLSAFEKVELNEKLIQSDEAEAAIKYSNECLSILESMQILLENPGRDEIRKYEQLKESLLHVPDVGAFWSALVNIRLNSVPILDFEEGIRQSVVQIKDVRKMITDVRNRWSIK